MVRIGNSFPLGETAFDKVKHHVYHLVHHSLLSLSLSLSLSLFQTCSIVHAQDEYVSQLQNQIHDLERYIAFLQAANPNHPSLNDDTSSSDNSSSHDYRTSTKSHDLTARSHDHHSKKNRRSSTSSNSRPKKVTFAESDFSSGSVPLPSPASRSRLVGPTLKHVHQPVPDYRLSLTQLDGVDCTIDSKMWEWERLDPLGTGFPGDYIGDQGLSETDKVCMFREQCACTCELTTFTIFVHPSH